MFARSVCSGALPSSCLDARDFRASEATGRAQLDPERAHFHRGLQSPSSWRGGNEMRRSSWRAMFRPQLRLDSGVLIS